MLGICSGTLAAGRSRYTIRISSRPAREIRDALSWWFDNRSTAPTLLLVELTAALGTLAERPHVGTPTSDLVPSEIRRLRLPRCRYHLYYEIDAGLRRIDVLAFRHASRRAGSEL